MNIKVEKLTLWLIIEFNLLFLKKKVLLNATTVLQPSPCHYINHIPFSETARKLCEQFFLNMAYFGTTMKRWGSSAHRNKDH